MDKICPYCKSKVFEFKSCYVCSKCYFAWSKNLKEWEQDNPNFCCCTKATGKPIDNIYCAKCGKIIKGKYKKC